MSCYYAMCPEWRLVGAAAVINSIQPLHTPIKIRCVRVCGRNAGYEVTCFSPTHINYFPSRSFVCVSRSNHITQERGTRHSFLFLVLPDTHTHERSFHLVIWSTYCVLCNKLNHKLWQHIDSQDSSVLIATGFDSRQRQCSDRLRGPPNLLYND
jgi:hypothetical protein